MCSYHCPSKTALSVAERSYFRDPQLVTVQKVIECGVLSPSWSIYTVRSLCEAQPQLVHLHCDPCVRLSEHHGRRCRMIVRIRGPGHLLLDSVSWTWHGYSPMKSHLPGCLNKTYPKTNVPRWMEEVSQGTTPEVLQASSVCWEKESIFSVTGPRYPIPSGQYTL